MQSWNFVEIVKGGARMPVLVDQVMKAHEAAGATGPSRTPPTLTPKALPGEPREDVKRPGLRGGKWYRERKHGLVRYGTPPSGGTHEIVEAPGPHDMRVGAKVSAERQGQPLSGTVTKWGAKGLTLHVQSPDGDYETRVPYADLRALALPTEETLAAKEAAAQKQTEPRMPRVSAMEVETPSHEAGTIEAVAGMDPRVMKVLGGNLYSGDMMKIAVKEMLQNAVDAARPMSKGAVTVDVDTSARRLIVWDNGGLSPKVMAKEFLDIGGSLKAAGSSGGYGLAKVAIYSNAARVKVSSVSATPEGHKVLGEMTFSGEDWLKSAARQATIPIHQAPVPPETPESTSIEVDLLPELSVADYQTSDFLRDFLRLHRLPVTVTATLNGQPVRADRPTVQEIGTFTTPDGGARITIHVSDEVTTTSFPYVQVLNKGLPQFQVGVSVKEEAPMPRLILADIEATAGPDSPGYPFRPDREGLREVAREALDEYIQRRLYRDAAAREQTRYQQLLNQAPLIPGSGGRRLVDVGGGLSAEEKTTLRTRPYLGALTRALDKVLTGITQAWPELEGEPVSIPRLHGIGVTPHWYGCNISGDSVGMPKNLILLNPYLIAETVGTRIKSGKLPEASRLSETAGQMVATMIHEYAHQVAHSHGKDFSGALTRAYGAMTPFMPKWTARLERVLKTATPNDPEGTTNAALLTLDTQRLRAEWDASYLVDLLAKVGVDSATPGSGGLAGAGRRDDDVAGRAGRGPRSGSLVPGRGGQSPGRLDRPGVSRRRPLIRPGVPGRRRPGYPGRQRA